jgi:hypothetical protein
MTRNGDLADILEPDRTGQYRTVNRWAPANPAGNFNLEVFAKLAHGEELVRSNLAGRVAVRGPCGAGRQTGGGRLWTVPAQFASARE